MTSSSFQRVKKFHNKKFAIFTAKKYYKILQKDFKCVKKLPKMWEPKTNKIWLYKGWASKVSVPRLF